jgi:hypothetical protein
MTKSNAQRDYEADVTQRPTYHDGAPRKSWDQLDAIAKWSWGRPAKKTLQEHLNNQWTPESARRRVGGTFGT